MRGYEVVIPLGATTIFEPSVFTGGLSGHQLQGVVLGVVSGRMQYDAFFSSYASN